MPPLLPTLTAIDGRLVPILDAIVAGQSTYLGANGEYAQCLKSHSNNPVDGADTPANRRNAAPTDRPGMTWNAMVAGYGFANPAAWPAAVEVHACDGPDGRGFVICLEVTINGSRYERVIGHGSESQRTRDWAVIANG